MNLLKFNPGMFDGDDGTKWHLMNDALNHGEFTACGIAFDGEATAPFSKKAKTKRAGKVTCPNCIGVIEFFRNKEIKFLRE